MTPVRADRGGSRGEVDRGAAVGTLGLVPVVVPVEIGIGSRRSAATEAKEPAGWVATPGARYDGPTRGNRWTVPVGPEEIARACKGDWQVALTPTKPAADFVLVGIYEDIDP